MQTNISELNSDMELSTNKFNNILSQEEAHVNSFHKILGTDKEASNT